MKKIKFEKPLTIDNFKIHELCLLFPYMDDLAFQELKKDVKKYGLRDMIKVWKGKIIDGKNRLKACLELGIKPGFENLPDDTNIVAYIKSVGLCRRDLNSFQRIEIAMAIEKYRVIIEGKEEKVKEMKKDPDGKKLYEEEENKKITKEANSDINTVRKVRTILRTVKKNPVIKRKIEKMKRTKTVEQIHKAIQPRPITTKILPEESIQTREEILTEELEEKKVEICAKKSLIMVYEEIIEKMKAKFIELGIWEEFKHEIYPIARNSNLDEPTVYQL